MKRKKGPARILVIDDTIIDNRILEILIKKILPDSELTSCLNGKFAIDKLNEDRATDEPSSPDYIFVDLTMPVMDGWEFLDEYILSNIDPHKNSKVYILTSSILKSDFVKSRSYSLVKDVIRKPLDMNRLKKVFELE